MGSWQTGSTYTCALNRRVPGIKISLFSFLLVCRLTLCEPVHLVNVSSLTDERLLRAGPVLGTRVSPAADLPVRWSRAGAASSSVPSGRAPGEALPSARARD